MRRSLTIFYKTPKNMGVAPRYDLWNEKYEPWEHMKRMGRLVGTGFYIPPEWYNHFRMFPPINHNFQQERTLNPQNQSEPTATGEATSSLSVERAAVREELGRKSRLLASEGMRYYNIFWVRKPLDRMEREYFVLRRKGIQHSTAIKKVLNAFYEEITAKRRVAAIQAEEAKLSGKFISMREAVVVMGVLSQLQRDQFSPHQAALLAKGQRERALHDDGIAVQMVRPATAAAAGIQGDADDGEAAAEAGLSPDALADVLAEEGETAAPTSHVTVAVSDAVDSIRRLKDLATDNTGDIHWYTGESPVVDLTEGESERTPTSPRPLIFYILGCRSQLRDDLFPLFFASLWFITGGMSEEERNAKGAAVEEDSSPEAVRLEHVPDYAALARLVGMDLESSPSSSVSHSALEDGQERSRSCASMSITSVMRAEAMLKKSLPLLRSGGATHVAFTKEDLQQIRDPEVLQFLEENSAMFKKYIKTASQCSPREPCVERRPKGLSAADVEAKISEFQKEIDTFITAVDDRGRSYRIHVESDGTLEVPLEDDAPFGSSDDEGVELDSDSDSERGDGAGLEQLAGTSEISRDVEEVEGSGGVEEVQEEELEAVPRTASRLTSNGSPPRVGAESPPTRRVRFSVPKASGRASKQKIKKRPILEAPTVRPLHDFLPAEDERIEELLRTDVEGTMGKRTQNPFVLSDAAATRLAELDKAIAKLEEVRGPLPPTSGRRYVLPAPQARPAPAPPSASASASTTQTLGNRYMEEMKERKKAEKIMSELNAAILRNQRELELLAQQAADDTPESVRRLRPEWAREVVPLATEEEREALLAAAREEEATAVRLGLESTGLPRDPYSSLLAELRDVSSRAQRLADEAEAEPLRVTLFDPDDMNDVEELGEPPENIRDELMEAI
eukprot:gene1025-613_t